MQEQPVEDTYKYRDGKLILIPYSPKASIQTEDLLIAVYNRMKNQDLLELVFHDNPELSLAQFITYFDSQRNLLQIIGVIAEDQVVDMAGVAWLHDICELNGLTRAMGAFCVFDGFQTPVWTDGFAELVIDYWFETLKIDVVIGLTPEKNRAALIFIKRCGFREAGRIPNFVLFKGQVCDAVISYMIREG